jgi:hypothetical protein
MLINLSNHPSSNWSEEQLLAAEDEFSSIVDLPFPQIDPNATAEQVQTLAKQYFEKVRKLFANSGIVSLTTSAVHLMGELTFCHTLVNLLLHKNYRCVASTTERTVIEEKDGKKTVQFRFVQFRDYL